MGRVKTPGSYGWIAAQSGRSREHVRRESLAGLVPKSLVPTGEAGASVALPSEVAADLVLLFQNRVVSPSLSVLMREDPEAMVACAEALTRLARLSIEEHEREPRLV